MHIEAIRPLADTALTLELSGAVGAEASARVAAGHQAIERAVASGILIGVSEVAAAFCSLTVHYDCLQIAQADLIAQLTTLLDAITPEARPAGRSWLLPCCYDTTMGLDLAALEQDLGMDCEQIISIHQETSFHVYALGFLPGLPFLGELPSALARPRRTEPRTRVPSGSVAIANRMCVIYPWNSPGGWHIVGRCPVPLFDISRPIPALIAVGDCVRFRSVSIEEFGDLHRNLYAATCEPASFQVAS